MKAEASIILTSKLSSGEFADGVFVGRECVTDDVDDGDSGGVIIPVFFIELQSAYGCAVSLTSCRSMVQRSIGQMKSKVEVKECGFLWSLYARFLPTEFTVGFSPCCGLDGLSA